MVAYLPPRPAVLDLPSSHAGTSHPAFAGAVYLVRASASRLACFTALGCWVSIGRTIWMVVPSWVVICATGSRCAATQAKSTLPGRALAGDG